MYVYSIATVGLSSGRASHMNTAKVMGRDTTATIASLAEGNEMQF